MKEKFIKLWEKTKEITAKVRDKVKSMINPRSVAATCAVMLVGCAVLLNFILFRDGGPVDDSGRKMAIDLTKLSDSGDGDSVSASADPSVSEDDYYAVVSLSRQQTRDEAMDVLQELSASDSADAAAKEAAVADINRIALDIEKEGNIEAMVVAKGFEKCVAVVNGDSASVIVSCDALTPGETAQISEIVYEAAGIVPANLKIIEKQ